MIARLERLVRLAGLASFVCGLALLVAACGSTTAASPAPSVDPASLTSPITGVLVKIEASGLTEVKGFTLRLSNASEVVFQIGILENGAQFPPGHLAEHLASSSPVRVFFRLTGADLVVYRIEDAP